MWQFDKPAFQQQIKLLENSPQVFLESHVEFILHPPKTMGVIVTKFFIMDAKFMAEYGLKLNFDDYTNATYNKFLGEIYLTLQDFNKSLFHINQAKDFYLIDKEMHYSDLEEVCGLEFLNHKKKGDQKKMTEVVAELEVLKEVKNYKYRNR